MIDEETTSQELRDERGRLVTGNGHTCPKCGSVGRVFHSHPRTMGERMRMILAPKHGIYRCHDCNWRGWKVRSKSTPLVAALVLALNLLILVAAAAVVLYLIWDFLPIPSEVP